MPYSNGSDGKRVACGSSLSINTEAYAFRVEPSSVSIFVSKLFGMVNDMVIQDLIGWSNDGDRFCVYDIRQFSKTVLPQYFKHNNWASFVRQLNMYGFHKVNDHYNARQGQQICEFHHPMFNQNGRQTIRKIRRNSKKNISNSPADSDSKLNLSTPSTDLRASAPQQHPLVIIKQQHQISTLSGMHSSPETKNEQLILPIFPGPSAPRQQHHRLQSIQSTLQPLNIQQHQRPTFVLPPEPSSPISHQGLHMPISSLLSPSTQTYYDGETYFNDNFDKQDDLNSAEANSNKKRKRHTDVFLHSGTQISTDPGYNGSTVDAKASHNEISTNNKQIGGNQVDNDSSYGQNGKSGANSATTPKTICTSIGQELDKLQAQAADLCFHLHDLRQNLTEQQNTMVHILDFVSSMGDLREKKAIEHRLESLQQDVPQDTPHSGDNHNDASDHNDNTQPTHHHHHHHHHYHHHLPSCCHHQNYENENTGTVFDQPALNSSINEIENRVDGILNNTSVKPFSKIAKKDHHMHFTRLEDTRATPSSLGTNNTRHNRLDTRFSRNFKN